MEEEHADPNKGETKPNMDELVCGRNKVELKEDYRTLMKTCVTGFNTTPVIKDVRSKLYNSIPKIGCIVEVRKLE